MMETLFKDQVIYTPPNSGQLLKWIGNKQRFASRIASKFPMTFKTYFEPFLGSGAVLATLMPSQGIGSDHFLPLVQIWQTLKTNPDELIGWYGERVNRLSLEDKKNTYEQVKKSYNQNPNGADLIFLSRACYGGVVRFRKKDGFMSTPCGIHEPISKDQFAKRVKEWNLRVKNSDFFHWDYQTAFENSRKGDLIYCDPPYSFSQSILYGAQDFSFPKLIQLIEQAKSKGVSVALSIDGKKKSGLVDCNLQIPRGLFEQELLIDCGRSMLKRFQMEGKTLESETVSDRLFLTYH